MAWSNDEVAEFLTTVRRVAEVVSPAREVNVITRDPSDNRVLEAAVAGQVDYIVSGDQHLLDLKAWEGTQIVAPARFVAILAANRL